jgi:hypothetical protein
MAGDLRQAREGLDIWCITLIIIYTRSFLETPSKPNLSRKSAKLLLTGYSMWQSIRSIITVNGFQHNLDFDNFFIYLQFNRNHLDLSTFLNGRIGLGMEDCGK